MSNRGMFRLVPVATAVALAISVFGAAIPAPSRAAINSASAVDIAYAMTPDNSAVTGASFVALPAAGAVGVSDAPIGAFPTNGTGFGILSTGYAATVDDPNDSESTGDSLGGGNVRGDTDYDVTVLKIDLNVPSGVNCLLGMHFQFFSEEYPEYVGTTYNDAFIAELDSSTWTTSGSTISAPNNFAFDPAGDVISINSTGATSMSAANAAGTTFDGATPVLTAATPITPGPHSLYLSIFDQGDSIYDSAVFLDRLELGTVANVETDCVSGAEPVDPDPPTFDLDVHAQYAFVGAGGTVNGGDSVTVRGTGYDSVTAICFNATWAATVAEHRDSVGVLWNGTLGIGFIDGQDAGFTGQPGDTIVSVTNETSAKSILNRGQWTQTLELRWCALPVALASGDGVRAAYVFQPLIVSPLTGKLVSLSHSAEMEVWSGSTLLETVALRESSSKGGPLARVSWLVTN